MWVCLLILSSACIEYGYHSNAKGTPDIIVDPGFLAFPLTNQGETSNASISVRNVGTADLDIHDLFFEEHPDIFSVLERGEEVLHPEEETEVVIAFIPAFDGPRLENFHILSNDPDEADTTVLIWADGSAPRIDVSPDKHDFGEQPLACEASQAIHIRNIGGLDLEVTGIRYFASVPTDFSLGLNQGVNQSLPWLIPPGDSRTIYVDYYPMDGFADIATIEVDSNDPLHPVVEATQVGDGDPGSLLTDVFEQDTEAETDVLFIIDNSCSMAQHQTNLAGNLPEFVGLLESASADYQIGIITTDDPFLQGPLIHSGMADPIGEFSSQATVGTLGDSTEMGLEMAYLHLSKEGWLRPDATLNVVYVSDEPDSSPGLLDDYVDQILTLKANPDDAMAHAIIGDPPSGCEDAPYGAGYYEVADQTGGSFISICSTDWATKITALASLVLSHRVFALSTLPVEGTIIVYVDGVEVTDWVYDADSNSIVFDLDKIPVAGQEIKVEYGVETPCP